MSGPAPFKAQALPGRYELSRHFGGELKHLWRGRDKRTRQPVVVKLVKGDPDRTGILAERLRREAVCLSLLHGAGVPRLHTYVHDQHYPVLVLENAGACNLGQWLHGKQWTLPHACGIALEIAKIMAEVHARGIIHRDIKPANIVLNSQQRPILIDFGIAIRRGGEASIDRPGLSYGTADYVSPEQARGETLDCRTDIYSFGVTLFELIGRTTLFKDDDDRLVMRQHIRKKPPSIRRFAPPIPRRLHQLLYACLEKEANNRPQTAVEVVARLQEALSGPRWDRLLGWETEG